MTPRLRLAAASAAVSLLAVLALCVSAAPAAPTAAACPLLRAAGHVWIVTVKGVSCATAVRVARGFAVRTAAVAHGRTVRVRSPLAGFACVLRNSIKPAGACAKGTDKVLIWQVAA